MLKIVVVGGSKHKPSSIIEKLHKILAKEPEHVTTYNSILPTTDIKEVDLTL